MNYNRTEVIKLSLYVISVSIFFELYMIFMSVIVNGKTLNEAKNTLVAAPLIFGPSLGYTVYRIMRYRNRIKTNLEFRRRLILRTTVETMAILIPLYILAVFLGFVRY